MMLWDRSKKLRTLARVLLVLAIASTIACARQDWIDRTLVTENVTGAWTGSFGEGNSYRSIQFELRQQGARVTGVMMVSPTGSGFGSSISIEGSVTGDVFTFRDQRGTYSGELTVAGDNLEGQIVSHYGQRRASLRRGGGVPQSDSATR